MKREEIFEIEDTDVNRNILDKAKPSLNILSSNVIILPSERESSPFYTGTIETFDYLRAEMPDDNVEIYAADEDYKELSLHSADIWLGNFWVVSIAAPIFTTVISSYIYDKLKAKDGDHITMKVIVEGKNGKSKSVRYSGDVKNLKKVIKAINDLIHD